MTHIEYSNNSSDRKSDGILDKLWSRLGEFFSKSWVAIGSAILGGLLCAIQLWTFAHTQESILDEGAYLFKGYLFASGQYSLFQWHGPWSNHMPLSFLIPGYVQLWFGPGLAVGRYLSILLAMLTILALWILGNRLGGRWWAAAAVWVYALNPSILKMYSLAVSQVLVACMLTWTLVLVLGDGRKLWQITLGAVIAGLLILTRINMLPVLPLLILYVFWQHGIKAGILATLSGALAVVLGHAYFWPGILMMWARTLPRSLTPFLDPWRHPSGLAGLWSPEVSIKERLLSFLHSLRLHFTAMIGTLATVLMFQHRNKWKSASAFRTSVFLLTLFVVLALLHMWAALGNDWCVFCLDGYLAFFSMVGILLIVASFSSWKRQMPSWYQAMIVFLILGISAGLGYGAFTELGNQLVEIQISRIIIDFPNGSTGAVSLGSVLTNKFGLEQRDLRRVLPTVTGLLVGFLILVLAYIVRTAIVYTRRTQNRNSKFPELYVAIPTFGFLAIVIFLLVGTLLSPAKALAGGGHPNDCGGDVIASNKIAGRHLATRIPPGSSVYWDGGKSVVPLLYLSDIQIYPPQINGDYSFKLEGDPDALLKHGRWNPELAQEWADQADFILIEQRNYEGWLKDHVNSGAFDELEPTPPTVYCRDNAQIRIFRRK